eukprot:4699925-Pyramimonas_sp.AAC.1
MLVDGPIPLAQPGLPKPGFASSLGGRAVLRDRCAGRTRQPRAGPGGQGRQRAGCHPASARPLRSRRAWSLPH